MIIDGLQPGRSDPYEEDGWQLEDISDRLSDLWPLRETGPGYQAIISQGTPRQGVAALKKAIAANLIGFRDFISVNAVQFSTEELRIIRRDRRETIRMDG